MNIQASILLKVDSQIKKQFELACAKDDITVAQALRQAMRRYVEDQVAKECARISLRVIPDDGGTMVDVRTGGLFSATEQADVDNLKRQYRLMDAFERLHPEVPLLPYNEREKLKQEGHTQRHAATLPERAEGYEKILRAHYARSAMDWLDTTDPFSYLGHPGYVEFARHYVAHDLAQGRLEEDLAGEMQRRFGPPEGPVKVYGSYWVADIPPSQPRKRLRESIG